MGLGEFFFLLAGLKWTRRAVGDRLRRRRHRRARRWRWLRTSASALLERHGELHRTLFQGTPLLMQLFVVYYGLALSGLQLDAWVAVADRLHACMPAPISARSGAAPSRPCRTARRKPPRRSSLSTMSSRMKDVILPQAIRISLPATIGFLVQLIKGTSLAAIVGFHRADAGREHRLQPDFPAAHSSSASWALFYFLMCWPLSLYGAHAWNATLPSRRADGRPEQQQEHPRHNSKGENDMTDASSRPPPLHPRCSAPPRCAVPALTRRRPRDHARGDQEAQGKIIVGIQGDNPPWGFVTSAGKQDGLDADIATLFAKELGVPVEFVPLEVNNRIPALTTGPRRRARSPRMAMLPRAGQGRAVLASPMSPIPSC